MSEFISEVIFNPLKEDTGKSYKINAATALCRYYKAKGWYKYTDEIDRMIGEACDKGHRILKFYLSVDKINEDIKSFLIQHYWALKFEINIDKTHDKETGEILYRIVIEW